MSVEPPPVGPAPPGAPSPLKGRMVSAGISLLIGPPIAGFLLGLMALPVNMIFDLHESIGFNKDLLVGALAYTLISPFVGAPVGILILAVGWIFFTRDGALPLKSVLLATATTFLPLALVFLLVTNERIGFSELPMIALLITIVGIPVLASAAICWRITRRWHSPERVT